MIITNRLLLTAALALATSAAFAAEPSVLLECAAGKAFRKSFQTGTDRGSWKADGVAYVGQTPKYYDLPEAQRDDHVDDGWTYQNVRAINMWSYALAGDAKWNNYTVATTVRIRRAAPLAGPRPGSVFFNYQWGREAVGSDAAILVRYQDADNNYMVRLSSGYGHLELWKTHGGVVQVKPFAFKPDTDYQLAVTVSGPWITVAVDGKEVIRYADPVEPLLTGRIGLAVRESEVAFSQLRVTPVVASSEPVPPHKPNFQVRDWVGRQTLFDGDEPIGWYLATDAGEGGALHEMKFVPGLMPMCIDPIGACWADISNRQKGGPLAVKKTGETLAFAVTLEDTKAQGFTDLAEWSVTYDPAKGYVWDQRVTLTMLKDDCLVKWAVNLLDPLFYQSVAPATGKLPACRVRPNWAVFTRPDGKYSVFPASHEWKNGGAIWDKLVVKPGGLWAHTIDRWALVMELANDNTLDYYGDYCFWGLDFHFSPTLSAPGTKVPPAKKGDVYVGHAIWYAWNPTQTDKAIRQGILVEADRNLLLTEEFAHAEPVNHFDQVVTPYTVDSKVKWSGAYAIDRTVGHGDAISMRIDGAAMGDRGNQYGALPAARIGPSWRTGPYLAAKYRIGCSVKAEDFTGTFAISADFIQYQKPREPKSCRAEIALQGKSDWRYVSFETDFPRFAHGWYLRLDPNGKGTVWVDDVDVTPLP